MIKIRHILVFLKSSTRLDSTYDTRLTKNRYNSKNRRFFQSNLFNIDFFTHRKICSTMWERTSNSRELNELTPCCHKRREKIVQYVTVIVKSSG